MKTSGIQIQRIGHSKVLHTVVFVIAIISFSLSSSNAWATTVAPTDYRVVSASGKFADTTQFAVAFRMRPPRRLRVRHLELAIGARKDIFLASRVQHTSNAGLSKINPGLDTIGLNFAINLSD